MFDLYTLPTFTFKHYPMPPPARACSSSCCIIIGITYNRRLGQQVGRFNTCLLQKEIVYLTLSTNAIPIPILSIDADIMHRITLKLHAVANGIFTTIFQYWIHPYVSSSNRPREAIISAICRPTEAPSGTCGDLDRSATPGGGVVEHVVARDPHVRPHRDGKGVRGGDGGNRIGYSPCDQQDKHFPVQRHGRYYTFHSEPVKPHVPCLAG